MLRPIALKAPLPKGFAGRGVPDHPLQREEVGRDRQVDRHQGLEEERGAGDDFAEQFGLEGVVGVLPGAQVEAEDDGDEGEQAAGDGKIAVRGRPQ